jgi:hypothetical protein
VHEAHPITSQPFAATRWATSQRPAPWATRQRLAGPHLGTHMPSVEGPASMRERIAQPAEDNYQPLEDFFCDALQAEKTASDSLR